MPSFKDWSTTYPAAQDPDPITGTQPALLDDPGSTPNADPATEGDNTRVSHPQTNRDKLQAVCLKVGDNLNLPAGCLLVRSPTTDQKAALAGTGTPTGANPYVVNDDTRMTDARIPGGIAGGGLSGNYPAPALVPSAGLDTTAVHLDADNEIGVITKKNTPVVGDVILLENSEAGGAKVWATVGSLPGGVGTTIDDTHTAVGGSEESLTTYATLANDMGIDAEILVSAIDTATGDRGTWTFRVTAYRNGSAVVTIPQSVESPSAYKDQVLWDARIDVSAQNIVIYGTATIGIEWRVTGYFAEVG